jgi:HAD superfamily hydrolase (TIGR01509 family)
LAEVPTGACAYVGDRVARDIQGAQAAGYRLAIQIRHDFHHGEDDNGAVPDATIDSLTEMIEILRAEQSASAPRRGLLPNPDVQVRALLFDAGDILYHRPNKGQQLVHFLTAQGVRPDSVPPEVLRALRSRSYRGEIGLQEYRRLVLGLYGVTEPAEVDQGLRALEQDDLAICVVEGVRDTLTTLKARGYMLGVITDTGLPVHVKLAWFAQAGFGDVWDCFLSSRELGIQKPDARIYHAALRQLGLSAGQAAFVGHAPAELDGARAIGMHTIAFTQEPGVVADDRLQSFPDLLDSPVLKLRVGPGPRTATPG